MLKAQINNQSLITDENFSCRLQVKNPACFFDKLPGAIAVDLSFPKRGNQGTLQNPDRISKRAKQNDRQFDDFRLDWNGINLIAGTLIINDPSEKYSGWAQSLLGKLSDELREKLISQIDLGTHNFVNKTNFDPLSDLWCTIRLMNKAFFQDRGKMTTYEGPVTDIYGNITTESIETELLSKRFMDLCDYFVNETDPSGVITSTNEEGAAVVSPFPFVHSLIDELLRANQFYMSDNFLKTDAELRTLCLYHTWSILKATITTETNWVTRMNYLFNFVEENELDEITSATWALEAFKLNELLPEATIGDVMMGIQNTANSFFWFDNNRQVKLIDREGILTGSAYDLSKYQVSKWQPGERKNVRLKFAWEHEDNDSAFSDAWTDLSNVRNRIKSPVTTYGDLNNPLLPKDAGDIRLVVGDGLYYEYKWHQISSGGNKATEQSKDVLGWTVISINIQDYYFNDGDREEEEIKSIFSTLRMNENGYPIAFQKGNNKIFSDVSESFSPRLMFYKGNNYGGNESSGGMKFTWEGDLGILRKRWRLWAPFWANRLPVKATFRLPPSEFYYLLNNVWQKFKSREGEFIVEEMNAEPGNDREVLVEISGYKVEDSFWEYNPGVVAGGGDGTNTSYDPAFVGTTATGKPYSVEANGKYYSTSIFGTISQAPYAPTQVVSYNETTRQLYVGGINGFLHIYDCGSPTFPMKSIQLYSSTNDVSCVRYIPETGQILCGRENSSNLYNVTVKSNINDYNTIWVSECGSNVEGYFRDFYYEAGKWYGITSEGELARAIAISYFEEQWDVSAHFTRFEKGGGYYYIFENGDRPFYSTDLVNWNDFDLLGGTEPAVLDTASNGSQVVAITDRITDSIFFIESPGVISAHQTGGYPRGVVYNAAGDLFLCGEHVILHSGYFYKWTGTYFQQQFILPDPLHRLFMY